MGESGNRREEGNARRVKYEVKVYMYAFKYIPYSSQHM